MMPLTYRTCCSVDARVFVLSWKGVRCHAWLYVPTPKGGGGGEGSAEKRPPVVLMAHGMGSQKVMFLGIKIEASSLGYSPLDGRR